MLVLQYFSCLLITQSTNGYLMNFVAYRKRHYFFTCGNMTDSTKHIIPNSSYPRINMNGIYFTLHQKCYN